MNIKKILFGFIWIICTIIVYGFTIIMSFDELDNKYKIILDTNNKV